MYQSSTALRIDEDCWHSYQRSRNIELRNQIAMEYVYIVKCIALRLRGIYENYATVDDMINQGVIALIDAVEKYDLSKNAKFESYASIRVRGAIIDYVRKQDWVPRRIKKEVKQVDEAIHLLANRLGRNPSNEEIAKELNLSVANVVKVTNEMQMFNMLSYEELLNNGLYGVKGYKDDHNVQVITPEYSLQEKELSEMIKRSINNLTEKEQIVISLYYYDELKLKEIAYVLGVSESRVCQIHSNALKKMKNNIGQYLKL